jgi:hypothetical protein
MKYLFLIIIFVIILKLNANDDIYSTEFLNAKNRNYELLSNFSASDLEHVLSCSTGEIGHMAEMNWAEKFISNLVANHGYDEVVEKFELSIDQQKKIINIVIKHSALTVINNRNSKYLYEGNYKNADLLNQYIKADLIPENFPTIFNYGVTGRELVIKIGLLHLIFASKNNEEYYKVFERFDEMSKADQLLFIYFISSSGKERHFIELMKIHERVKDDEIKEKLKNLLIKGININQKLADYIRNLK